MGEEIRWNTPNRHSAMESEASTSDEKKLGPTSDPSAHHPSMEPRQLPPIFLINTVQRARAESPDQTLLRAFADSGVGRRCRIDKEPYSASCNARWR
jgi:hypothetical protein